MAKTSVTLLICKCSHPKRSHTLGGEHKCCVPGCACRGYKYEKTELPNYLDMTIREVFEHMASANAGRFAFNGPGPKGDAMEPYCCAFAVGMEDAKKLSRQVLGSTDGLPSGRKERA